MGMVQRRQHVSLALETRAPIGVVTEGSWQHLDRDVAAKPRVVGAVDLSHSAGTDTVLNLVEAECPARESGSLRRAHQVRCSLQRRRFKEAAALLCQHRLE